jgi:hypothetical protein
MKITTRVKDGQFVELNIESSSTKITEDLSVLKNGTWSVPNQDIEQLITAANDCSRFNGIGDVQFVKTIFDSFLSDHEKSKFIELVSKAY